MGTYIVFIDFWLCHHKVGHGLLGTMTSENEDDVRAFIENHIKNKMDITQFLKMCFNYSIRVERL